MASINIQGSRWNKRRGKRNKSCTCSVLLRFFFCSVLMFVFSTQLINISTSTEGIPGYRARSNLRTDAKNDLPLYSPGKVEQIIMDHLVEWGWDKAKRNVKGCDIWKSEPDNEAAERKETTTDISQLLNSFRRELNGYYKIINSFQPTIPDVLEAIRASDSRHSQEKICETLRLHPDGIQALFPSKQLSYTSTSGFIEPLTTPMRHPDFCFDTSDKRALMDMEYLVHDFEAMCLSLKPTSRRILIDLGASLSYHKETQVKAEIPPIVSLLELYEKFGFNFDHIYAFEIEFTEPSRVFRDLLPERYMPSYHWINTGVNAEKGHKLNPLHSILSTFRKEDFVVLKIDIDTASIEVPLVHQLLEDENLCGLVDQFYFEHHVTFKEMAPIWRSAMKGSLKDTFDLFHGLRRKGVPAHFWP